MQRIDLRGACGERVAHRADFSGGVPVAWLERVDLIDSNRRSTASDVGHVVLRGDPSAAPSSDASSGADCHSP